MSTNYVVNMFRNG